MRADRQSGMVERGNRFYVQNGKTFANSQFKIAGVAGNSLTTAWCDAQKTAFGGTNAFDEKGGMASMDSAMAKGVVLVISVWDDHCFDVP